MYLIVICHLNSWDSESFSYTRKIGIVRQIDFAVALFKEKLLPLAHHSQCLIVKEHNLDRKLVAIDGRELLDIHHHRPVACNIDDACIRIGELCSDGRWKS